MAARLPGSSITEPDQLLIELAVKGCTQEEIARQTGLTSRTVRRRMENPKIRKAIKQYCDLVWENRLRRVANNFDKMESVFLDLMDDDNQYLKLQAAIQMRNICFHGRELELSTDVEELRNELNALKEQIQGGQSDDVVDEEPDSDDEEREPLPGEPGFVPRFEN